jgi:DNA-binding IclR family transcriptional regulator
MTITEVAGAVGITYPTAHKCLDLLVREKAIQAVDKSTYSKL